MFNKFKRDIKDMNVEELNKELQKRRELMFKWNQPNERNVHVELEGKGIRTYCKHPFNKIRREIAILNTLIHLNTVVHQEVSKELK